MPSTGDAALDFALEAGPRTFTDDLPKHLQLEIAKNSALGPYLEAVKKMAQTEIAEIHREIDRVSIENRLIEKHSKATRTHIPHCRIPASMWLKMEDIYGQGCWKDENFMEDTLRHHPGLRINVKRGIRGQEYVKGK